MNPDSYIIISNLFPRILGFIYFLAIFPFLFQIRGLIGSEGILPIDNYLDFIKTRFRDRRFYRIFTLFWINSSDTALITVVISGLLCSVLLMGGVAPPLMILLLYIIYLSIVNTGQDFLSFGWEVFLLEITVNAFFLSLTHIPNPMVWISINFLLFRFHVQAGAVKLQSHDASWRNLTALTYHYMTQPLPNMQAWYFHRFPMLFQKISCFMMFFIELAVPFALFFGEDARFIVFLCFFGLQFLIWFTGNLSYLNYLTVGLSTILLSDKYLSPIFGLPTQGEPSSTSIEFIALAAGSILFALQLMRLWHHFFWNPTFENILRKVSPYFIANRYGIFAVMTTKRYEIVVEGSHDGVDWKEYTFKWKPSEISRRPRRISPYQPRIDWQAWFLPFSNYDSEPWFQNFLYRLLKGSEEVLSLLRDNPFKDKPPRYIRALAYDYDFTDLKEKQETGNWWKRTLVGAYSPTLEIKDRKG